jgi:uncharacterized protein (TIGR03083 family)
MSSLDYLDHLATESARFLAVLRGTDLSTRVPSCPDWDAADLLWHLGHVQWFWGSIVVERRSSPEGLEEPPRPDSDHGLVQFFEEQSARLHLALSEADPAEQVYMWSDEKTVGYIRRRQAHEALIHRLDAELAADDVTPLDPALASDGVLEVLDKMFGGTVPWGTFTSTGTQAEFRVADTGLVVPVVLGRFTGTDPRDGTVYDDAELSVREADPSVSPQVVVSGTADDLDAWLWHRRDAAGVRVEGDPVVRDQLLQVLSQPID